jgi:hypothetical protein
MDTKKPDTQKITVHIQYIDNFTRMDFGEFILATSNLKNDLIPFVFGVLAARECAYNADKGYFMYRFDKQLISFNDVDVLEVLKNNKIEVVYSEVVLPSVACNIDEVGGIDFFLHTNEKNHIGRPHIHAKYSGEEISIDIFSGEIIAGSFKSPAKQRLAVERVQRRREEFMQKWQEWCVG